MLYNIFSMIRIIMTSMGGEAGEYNRDRGGGGGGGGELIESPMKNQWSKHRLFVAQLYLITGADPGAPH